MIKKLLATSALVAVPFVANAADMAVKAAPVATVMAPAPFTWTGWYIGGTIGYGKQELFRDDISRKSTSDGFTGGLHTGYNWQSGTFVYGWEADVSATSINGRVPTTSFETTTVSSRLMATLRARMGLAFDRSLIYATAGGSYMRARIFTDDNSGETTNHNVWGYVVGGGWEYAINNNLIYRAEGLYNVYDKTRSYDFSCGGGCEDVKINHVWNARTGFSYKF